MELSKRKGKILFIFYTVAMHLLAAPSFSEGHKVDIHSFSEGLQKFGINLFSELARTNRGGNVVFSPFSIHTCIAMARMGADGETAVEMDKALSVPVQNTDELAQSYRTLLGQYEDSKVLKIANKIYVMEKYELQDNFNKLLSEKFLSTPESLNFANGSASAAIINAWVESKTNNLIKDLVSPNLLDANTRLVLVNAIHFKGNWVHQFPEHSTRPMDFYLDENNKITVQMMHIKENFKYGEFDELSATALELPYKDSDLSMLIILPNSRMGLVELENKLQTVSLSALTQRMYYTKVIADVPKFKAEFQAELTEPLKKMGMGRMFAENAEFAKMLKSKDRLKVSSVIHKAFIEVNERGTEAAAATGMAKRKRSIEDFTEIKRFSVEYPFAFKVLQKIPSETAASISNFVLFAGKIENIPGVISSTLSSLYEIKDEF